MVLRHWILQFLNWRLKWLLSLFSFLKIRINTHFNKVVRRWEKYSDICDCNHVFLCEILMTLSLFSALTLSFRTLGHLIRINQFPIWPVMWSVWWYVKPYSASVSMWKVMCMHTNKLFLCIWWNKNDWCNYLKNRWTLMSFRHNVCLRHCSIHI